MAKTHFLIAFFLLYTTVVSTAQNNLVFKNFSTKDGLPSSEVYKLHKDENGFIWFCTDRGISRFDGQTFRTFNTASGLCDNTIYSCTSDTNNQLFTITQSGCISIINQDSIRNIPNTRNGDQFLLRALGPNTSLIRDQLAHHFNSDYHLIMDQSGFIYEDANPAHITALISDNNDAISINKYNKPLFQVPLDLGLARTYLSKYGTTIAVLSGETIRVFKNNQLTQSIPIHAVSTSLVFLENEHTLWYGTRHKGIYKVDLKHGTTANFLPGYSVTDILVDGDYIWFSTLNKGVFCSISGQIKTVDFSKYTSKNSIRSIKATTNHLWFTTYDHYGFTLDSNKHLEPIRSIRGRDLLVDRNQNIWVSMGRIQTPFPNGAILFNATNQQVLDSSFAFYRSAFITGDNELVRFRNKFGNRSYSGQWKFIKKYIKHPILHSFELNDSTGLLGCADGLYLWNSQLQTVMSLGDELPILKNRINHILRFNNYIILCSSGSGLLVLDQDNLLKVNTIEGLPSNFCNMAAIGNNTLWVATNNGISRIQFPNGALPNYQIDNFTKEDGLLTNEIQTIDIWKDEVYAGSPEGLIYFPTGMQKTKHATPNIYWKHIKSDGQSIPFHQPLSLHNHNNSIEMSFGGISSICHDKLKYIFQFSKDGTLITLDTIENTNLNFYHLEVGEYQVEISALLHHQVSKKTLVHSLIIQPAFWQTIWFRMVFILVCLLLAALGVYLYIRRINRTRDLQLLKQKNKLLSYHNQSIQEQLKIRELEKTNLHLELEKNSQELSSYTLHSVQYSTLFRSLIKQISTIQLSAKVKNKKELEHIKSQLKSNLFQEKQWTHFNDLFKNVHKDFLAQMKQKHQTLTANELRICCLIKLGLLPAEIASIMNISGDSLNSATYRIRKKMELEKGKKLADYLINFKETGND